MDRPMRILIVDDDRHVRLVLGRALRALSNHCRVTTARSGEEALDYVRRTAFDVVVTDLLLGRLGGVELTEAIRRQTPTTAVIWVTAHWCSRFEAQRERLGVDRCMEKPVKVGELRRTVLDALQSAGRANGQEGVRSSSDEL